MKLRPVVAALSGVLLSSYAVAAPEPLRVRVVDSMNAAVEGARVTAGGHAAELTGPGGAVGVQAAGVRTLRVERDGFEPVEVRLSATHVDEIVVRLRPAIMRNSVDWEKFYYSATAGVSHTAGDRPSSVFRDQDTSLTMGYTLSSVWRVSVEGRYGHFHVEDSGPETARLSGSCARVGRGGFSANLDNSTSRSWGYMRFYQSHGKPYITDGFRSTDSTSGFRLSQNFALTREMVVEVGSDELPARRAVC
jgi:hypothetical protein